MSSRSMTPPPAADEADLESTAELPVLDPPVARAAEEEHSATDTWAVLPALRPEHDAQLAATLEAVSAELRSAQQLLNSKTDRLIQLERERDEAHAAGAASSERARELDAALTQLKAQGEAQAAQLAEVTQARSAAEQHAAGLSAELAHLRAGGDATAADLTQLRAAAEQRAAQLDAELTRLQGAATQHASEFAALTQARSAAEQRIVMLEGEVTAQRARAAAAEARITELEQRVAAEAGKVGAHENRAAREAEERTARDREHAQHTQGVMADLHHERTRAMACFESLQTVHTRRNVFEALVTELTVEADVRTGDLERLSRELAQRDARLREQDGELQARAQRISKLDKEVAGFGTALAERDAQLRDLRAELATRATTVANLQAQLAASGERIKALTAVTEQHSTSESQRKGELSRLLAERVELTTALEAARARATEAGSQAEAQDRELKERRGRVSELEGRLATQTARASELEKELAELRTEMDEWGDTLKSVHEERGNYQSRVEAAEASARSAEQRAAEQLEALNAAQAEALTLAARVRELEADLVAAEDSVHRLESEGRKSGARVEELEKSQAQLRATLADARHGATDTSANPALREAARQVGEAMLPDGALRLLIANEGGREVVHVLGRKTSVGRTPDNDLQIDAKFISRHHAVILAGPAQTIIEDLNSTNGVQVNGRRITRQVLEDGDVVAIGRQQYRFVVRRSEKR